MKSLLLCFLTLVLIICSEKVRSAALSDISDHCSWILNNVTGLVKVEEIGSHKYTILENCLYYNLSMQADKELKRFDTLSELPPMKNEQTEVPVTVKQAVLKEFYVSKVSGKMRMVGYLIVSWTDYRLHWDPAVWKVDHLSIKSAEDIWVPEPSKFISGQLFQRAGDAIIFHNIAVSSTGRITATLEFAVSSSCTNDHRNFPLDVVNCCVYADSLLDNETVAYTRIGDLTGFVDIDNFKMTWDIKRFHIETVENKELSSPVSWRMCLQATRYSRTLKMQLSIPMFISGILVVAAPFFGSMQTQIWIKVFSLLMQLICFQFLVALTPSAGLGNDVPKIYSFYEFTFAMTLISMIITLILKALSRIEKNIPPPHQVLLWARTVNTLVCCSNHKLERPIADDSGFMSSVTATTGPAKQSVGDTESGTNQWAELSVATNNALSVIFVVIYLFVALIL